ncbi:ISL3 family transposase [Nannocystis exedens]|uniref:ISL3 family transposase n=1 Tax=Nannocystis exedens TaxID=54 RepID=UPI000BBA0988|nr:ISL3 family transposase [Nannocystis exedens]
MAETELYARILGIEAPWRVAAVKLQLGQGQIVIEVEHDPDVPTTCPECGQAVPRHDTRTRRWRHLDTCQYRTIIEAGVPRTSCPKHGTLTMRVSWADGSARLTALFEALVIDWLRDAPIAVVAERLGLSWDQVAGVQERAVQRGLERREVALPEMLAVDETSFQRRHEYVTIVHDPKSASKRVIHVADGRGKGALKGFLSGFSRPERAAVSVVVMDMHEPYIQAVREAIPDGDAKIAFDKYHVAARLGQAVDHVRREEHRALHGLGDNRLKGTKYLWLRNPERMSKEVWDDFEALRTSSLRTARAWALKEAAMEVWEHTSPSNMRDQWGMWYDWAIRSRLEPMKAAARMVKNHLGGIIHAATERITNASAEGLNSVIQKLKYVARGFRNRDRFRAAIYFHLGGLDLYPAGITR